MSIYTYLRRDHRRVKDLLQQIEELDPDQISLRDELFNKLKTQVILHAKAEEKIFYSPLQRFSLTEEEIKQAREEHAEVEKMLERLSERDFKGAAWFQLFESMANILRHHIIEEETQIFEDAETELSSDKAQEMERAMISEKKAVEKKMDPDLR
ncbi:Alr3199 protein [Legionella lansingensis]|uniref:DNA nickase n=1 Tax=Legionella lansingensis TaxID=45067 RepID=A0A0W0VQ37_9GAMM|nr:hemerythrin domain-containing protein [Legionella lansingensis]KTD22320.1 DNA nickase [Legionella lansingensis]SNV50746.1 Alr3199 protein [Legionella lansingensis]